MKFETIIDKIIFHLNNKKIQDMKNSTSLFNLITKIFFKIMMQKSNAFIKYNLILLFYNDY